VDFERDKDVKIWWLLSPPRYVITSDTTPHKALLKE
jgi:hypothetical protein